VKTNMLVQLEKVVGRRALRALARGCYLTIWRDSSPHNWFIYNKKETNCLWHSAAGFPRPALRMFNCVENSTERVTPYFGADSGMPCESKYVLKAKHINKFWNDNS